MSGHVHPPSPPQLTSQPELRVELPLNLSACAASNYLVLVDQLTTKCKRSITLSVGSKISFNEQLYLSASDKKTNNMQYNIKIQQSILLHLIIVRRLYQS